MADALHDALLGSIAAGSVDTALRLVIQNLAARPTDGLLRRVVAQAALRAGRPEDAALIGSLAFAADLAGGQLLGALASLALVRDAGGDASPMWSTLSQTIGRTGFAKAPRAASGAAAPLLDPDYPAISGEQLLAAASTLAARPVDLPPTPFGPVTWLGFLSNDAIRWALPRLRITSDAGSVPADAVCWVASGGNVAPGTCSFDGPVAITTPAELAWLSASDASALGALPGARAARDSAAAAARVADAIEKSVLWRTLAPNSLRHLLAAAYRSNVECGPLAGPSRPFSGLGFVIDGRVTLLRHDDGQATVADSLGAGGVFGEWTFAGDDAQRWELVVREDAELVWVEPGVAHAVLAAEQAAFDALVALCAARSTRA